MLSHRNEVLGKSLYDESYDSRKTKSVKRNKSYNIVSTILLVLVAITVIFIYKSHVIFFAKYNMDISPLHYGYNPPYEGKSANMNNIMKVKCSNSTHHNTCTQLIWKGESLTDLPKNKKIEVSVVISYCGEDMSLFNDYINDNGGSNIVIKSMTTISTCPYTPFFQNVPVKLDEIQFPWQYPDINFIRWIAAQDTNAAFPKHYLQDNHFILFLNAKLMKGENRRLRKLHDVLQSTLEDGLGCIQRPALQKSYYHNRQTLRTFEHPSNTFKTRHYNNLGDWQDQLNITITSIIDKEVVPVCYGSSFAIKSRDLSLKSKLYFPLIKAIEADIKNHGLFELVEFLERTWASIFSYPLPKEKVEILQNYTTSIFNQTCCHTGSLLHRMSDSYFKLFKGDTLRKEEIDYTKLRISLVISHCNENMLWMQEYVQGLQIQNVTIYSKCNFPIEGYSPPGSTIVRLPNVGRCDHSYAHWMKQMEEKDATDDHIVLFIKASRYIHQTGMSYRPLNDIIRIAIQHGFACELTNTYSSLYHNTSILKMFHLKEHRKKKIASKYKNMGEWLDELGIELPTPYTSVCYGGNFAVKASQIYSRRNELEKLDKNLMRGDNIEEGHFTERCWAGLLSHPLSLEEKNVLQSLSIKVGQDFGGYVGYMILDD